MYAIKKHINKVLAVFLCACLLLSYNPAFGAVDAAWAADGEETTHEPVEGGENPANKMEGVFPDTSELDEDMDGVQRSLDITKGTNRPGEVDLTDIEGSTANSASTIVKVNTFNSKLELDCSSTVYGKVKDIANEEVFPIIVEAVYAEGPSKNDYIFVWSVEHEDANGTTAVDVDLNQSDFLTPAVHMDPKRHVAVSTLNLAKVFETYPDKFKDGTKYTFKCTVTTTKGETQTDYRTIDVFTVDQSDIENNYKDKTRLDSSTENPHVVAFGKFLGSAELYTQVPALNLDGVYGAFTYYATELHPTSGIETYSIGDKSSVYKPDIAAYNAPEFNGAPLPPYYGNTYDLLFPIDGDYVYDADTNTNGYRDGFDITLLWKNDNKTNGPSVQPVPAKVYYDSISKQYMARVTYDTSGSGSCYLTDSDGNKIEGTEVPTNGSIKPGYFTVLYDSERLKPDGVSDEYYYVTTTVAKTDGVIGGSLISGGEPQGDKVTRRLVAKVPDESTFEIVPNVNQATGERYKLKSLKFTNSKDPDNYTDFEVLRTNVPGSTTTTVPGLTIDAAWSKVTIGAPLSTDYRAQYTFEAEFELAETNTTTTACKDIELSVVKNVTESNPDGEFSNWAMINATYTAVEGGAQKAGVTASTSQSNPMPLEAVETSMLYLTFDVHAPEGDTNYRITDVQTRTSYTEKWRSASWENYKLVVPSVNANLQVRVITSNDAAPQGNPAEYYLLTVVKEGGDANCKVSPQQQVMAVKNGRISEALIEITDSDIYCASEILVDGEPYGPFKYGDTKFTYSPTTLESDPTITVKFVQRSDLTYQVRTEATIGGVVTPSYTSAVSVAADSDVVFQIVPDAGYTIQSVTTCNLNDGSNVLPQTNNVLGGSLTLKIKEDTLLSVMFKKMTVPAGEPPVTVRALVAQKDQMPAYDNAPSDLFAGAPDDLYGHVDSNTENYVEATVPYGDRFAVSFYPETGYEVERVLVIKYRTDFNSDGELYRIYEDSKSYTTQNLSWIEAGLTINTDIVVFFRALNEGEKPSWDKNRDYIGVFYDLSEEGGSVDPEAQDGEVPVRVKKGGSLSVSFIPEPDFAFDGAEVYRAIGSSATGTPIMTIPASDTYYVLTGLNNNIVIKPYWKSTKVVTPEPTQVSVSTAANYTDKAAVQANGKTVNSAGVLVDKNVEFPLTIATTGNNTIEKVKFGFDSSAKAYIGTKKIGDKDYPALVFANTPPTTGTWALYSPNDDIAVSALSGVSDLSAWYVSGLTTNLTVGIDFGTTTTTKEYRTITSMVTGLGTGTVSIDGTFNTNRIEKGKGATVKITPAPNSYIKSVDVRKKTTGLDTVWQFLGNLLGITSNTDAIATTAEAFTQTGILQFTKVDFDYDIVVCFEIDPNYSGELTNKVAVHAFVVDGAAKGNSTVTPATVLLDRTTGTQEFVVDPGKDSNKKFYKIKEIVLTDYLEGGMRATYTVGEANSYFDWNVSVGGTPYRNCFRLKTAELPTTTNNYTIEVWLTDDGDAGNITPVPETRPTSPETPEVKTGAKWAMAEVNTVGATSSTNSGIGGAVYPSLLVLSDNTKTQTVDVLPAPGYKLDSVVVVSGAGSFTVPAIDPAGISFTLDWSSIAEVGVDKPLVLRATFSPLPDATYDIEVKTAAVDTDKAASGTVTPGSTTGLPTSGANSTQTLNFNPTTKAYTVAGILDQYVDANGDLQTTPGGLTWTRAKNEATKESALVQPIKVGSKVVNRIITVQFGLASDYDWKDNTSTTKTTIRVSTLYSTSVPADERTVLHVSPKAENANGTYTVSKSTGSRYTFSYYVDPDKVPGSNTPGYKIYRVMVNGKNVMIAQNNAVSQMVNSGAFTFTLSDLTRSVNTLSIYVTRVEADDTVLTPDPDQNTTIDLGWGSGGVVSGGENNSGKISAITSKNSNGAAPTSELFDNDRLSNGVEYATAEVNVEGYAEITIEPDKDKQIDMVYMYGCTMADFLWYDKSNPEKEGTSLFYVVQVPQEIRENPDVQPAVFVTFKDLGKGEKFDPKDWWAVDDSKKMLDSDLTIYLKGDDDEMTEMRQLSAVKNATTYGNVDKLSGVLSVVTPKAGVGAVTMSPEGPSTDADGITTYQFGYYTVNGNDVEVTVGPLLDWNKDDIDKSLLYTIDPTGVLVNGDAPLKIEGVDKDGKRHKIDLEAVAAEADDETDTEADTPTYYGSYVITGKTLPKTEEDPESAKTADLDIPMVKLTKDAGNFNPSFDDMTGNNDNPTPPGPSTPTTKYVVIGTSVANDGVGGKIVPTKTSTGATWTDNTNVTAWSIPDGTPVAFKMEADEGYVFSSLTRNGAVVTGSVDGNGVYEFSTNYTAASQEQLVATFAKRGSEESYITLTIEVEGGAAGHGTTSPAPGTHRYEKGSPIPITFVPDDGYVPYYIWVDGVRSYVSPTLVGWTLPASYSNRTFKVQYARSGTSPTLVPTGQDVVDAATGLVRTGDTAVWLIGILAVAAVAGVGVWQMRRRKAAADRAAKYSVTKRK